MIPKTLLRHVTNEERLFLRKWRYGVGIVYGILALALVGLGVLTTSGKNSVEATSSPAHNPAIQARIR
jgi:glucose uptake protein GlcU